MADRFFAIRGFQTACAGQHRIGLAIATRDETLEFSVLRIDLRGLADATATREQVPMAERVVGLSDIGAKEQRPEFAGVMSGADLLVELPRKLRMSEKLRTFELRAVQLAILPCEPLDAIGTA